MKSFNKATEAHPESVRETLLLCRHAGIIPEEWVADQRAPEPDIPESFRHAEDLAKQVASWAKGFTFDLQLGQELSVEVSCEAEGLIPRLARVAGDYGVPVYSGAGFDGLKAKRAFAERAGERDVPTVVLTIGDLDKHGGWIHQSSAEDSIAWSIHHYKQPPGWLTFVRVAITKEQAIEYDVLDADGKAEADAIPVPAMDGILTEALDGLLDSAGRERVYRDTEQERYRLADAIRAELDHWNDEDPDDNDEDEELW